MIKRQAYIPTVDNITMNEHDLFLLVGMQYFNMIQHSDSHCMYFTMDMLITYFSVQGRKSIDQLYDSFYKLHTLGIFEWQNQCNKINKNTPLFLKMKHFDKYNWCNLDFVDLILFSDYNINKKKNTLLTYIALEEYAGNKRYAYPSIRTLSRQLSLSKQTIECSLDVLVDLDIIIANSVGGKFYNKTYVFSDSDNIKADIKKANSEVKKFKKSKEFVEKEIRSVDNDILFNEMPDL